MNIVVVGMGAVGIHIVEVLITNKHNVTIIDNDPIALAYAEDRFDAMTMLGHAGSVSTLTKAGVANADLFVAVTDHDAINLISCIRAKAIGAAKTIARVLDPEYFETERGLNPNMMGIDLVINPLFQIANDIRKMVRASNAIAIQDFADHQIEMLQLHMQETSKHIGKPLKDMRLPPQTIIAALLRAKELIIPRGYDFILAGDEVIVVGRTEKMDQISSFFSKRQIRKRRYALIVGAGHVGLNVARSLLADKFKVVILDPDRKKCIHLAEQLRKVTVLNADGTDAAILQEQNVAQADVFIAVSSHDEVNLLSSLLAKDLGTQRSIALVHKPDYAKICERIGIDATLSPRLTVAHQVLKYVREGQIVSIDKVLQGKAEFLEFLVPEKSRIAHKSIQDANFPRGSIVCAVLSAEGAIVPNGQYVLQPNDQVVVFARNEIRAKIEELFKHFSITKKL